MAERQSLVIDTNVLLHDPTSLEEFPGQDLIVPVTVLEELDKLKKQRDDLGSNARMVIRYLDSLKDKPGNLHEGVSLENGATLRIHLSNSTEH